jgi:hypothetical protein
MSAKMSVAGMDIYTLNIKKNIVSKAQFSASIAGTVYSKPIKASV